MKAHRLLFGFLAVVPTMAACELIEKDDTDPPVLFNVGTDLDAYDPGSNTAGSLTLDTQLSSILTEFGPGTPPSFAWTFTVTTNAGIIAPISGKVSSLAFDDVTQSYEIRIRPKTDSVWVVILSNLSAPLIADGDTVAAGDDLATAAPGAGFGYSLFSIRVDDTDKDEAYCPFAHFDQATLLTESSNLSAALAIFEANKGDSSIYDESAWFLPGCLDESVPY